MTGQLTTAGEPAPAAGDPAPTAAEADIRDRAASLRHITQRIADDPALPEGANASRSLQEALKFLEVAAASPAPVAPSKAVDVAWHHFILFTRDYSDYCADHLGRFVHHVPDDTDDTDDAGATSDRRAYARTRELLRRRFGDLDRTMWPDADASSDCESKGNCSSECSGDCRGN